MKEDNSLSPSNIPAEVRDIAIAIAEGRVKNAHMDWKSDGTVIFSADSPDGKASFMMKKREFAGISEEHKTNISKPKSIEERLQRVKEFKQRGCTQTEIARFTMSSQKTVSNDIQKLIERGELD